MLGDGCSDRFQRSVVGDSTSCRFRCKTYGVPYTQFLNTAACIRVGGRLQLLVERYKE